MFYKCFQEFESQFAVAMNIDGICIGMNKVRDSRYDRTLDSLSRGKWLNEILIRLKLS